MTDDTRTQCRVFLFYPIFERWRAMTERTQCRVRLHVLRSTSSVPMTGTAHMLSACRPWECTTANVFCSTFTAHSLRVDDHGSRAVDIMCKRWSAYP